MHRRLLFGGQTIASAARVGTQATAQNLPAGQVGARTYVLVHGAYGDTAFTILPASLADSRHKVAWEQGGGVALLAGLG